jgi:hypothetical protein
MVYKVQPTRTDFPGETIDDKVNYVLALPYNILSSLSDGDLLKCFALLYCKQNMLTKITLASELRLVRRPYDAKVNEIKTLFRFDTMSVMFLMTDFELGNFTVNFDMKKTYNVNPIIDPMKMIAFLPELKSYLSFDYDKFAKDITSGLLNQDFVAQAQSLLGVPFLSLHAEPVMSVSSKSFDVAEFSGAQEVK